MPKRRRMDIYELLFQEDAVPNLHPKTRTGGDPWRGWQRRIETLHCPFVYSSMLVFCTFYSWTVCVYITKIVLLSPMFMFVTVVDVFLSFHFLSFVVSVS